MRITNVILSGGVGSRLWPLSRKSRPKQYLPIFEDKTLFYHTVARNRAFCDAVVVVGNHDNFQLSRRDLMLVTPGNYAEIIEACPRNTAAAIAFAAFAADPSEILLVTPSDHLIDASDAYASAVTRSIELASQGYIVTFGLKPLRPETGFGYIESNGEAVLSFREKPSSTKAQEFLDAGNFYWNSGMFCFQAGVYLKELEKFEPEVFQRAKEAFEAATAGVLDLVSSMKIPSISVDYAVMERTDKIKVVPSYFNWSDMGSFESIYAYFVSQGQPVDAQGNMKIGTGVHTEFVGLRNCLFIATPDANLILQKEHAQEVKQVFERLAQDKPDLV